MCIGFPPHIKKQKKRKRKSLTNTTRITTSLTHLISLSKKKRRYKNKSILLVLSLTISLHSQQTLHAYPLFLPPSHIPHNTPTTKKSLTEKILHTNPSSNPKSVVIFLIHKPFIALPPLPP